MPTAAKLLRPKAVPPLAPAVGGFGAQGCVSTGVPWTPKSWNMDPDMSICVCVYVYVYVYVYAHIYIYIQSHMYIKYTSIHIYVHMYIYILDIYTVYEVYVCMCTYIHVCIYIYVYMCVGWAVLIAYGRGWGIVIFQQTFLQCLWAWHLALGGWLDSCFHCWFFATRSIHT